MWSIYKSLHSQGILSINKRNSDYVLRYNPRKLLPLVDDKLKTKKMALDAGLDVPDLYAVIKSEHQIANIDDVLAPYKDFVIKPAHGAGGDGILVIADKIMQRYRLINGQLLSSQELKYHLSCILSGSYSLGGHPDQAIIEHRVCADPVFSAVSFEGIPDLRIIVLLGYPVMAMARLPTRSSGGKANLHQGAIGVGINICSGVTQGGVCHNDTIDFHPDTLAPIHDIKIPHWNKVLNIAASCYELTGLGYIGVDIVLDKEHGPLILELNARPGLNIQIANREGLVKRYQLVESQVAKGKKESAERVAFSKQCFANS